MTKNDKPNIFFHYEIQDFILDKPEKLKSWIVHIAAEEKKDIQTLNYIFCSDEYLLDLNKSYLGHDYYTDILSFPLQKDPIEGDVFISIERVRDNSEKFKIPFHNELYRVIIHGLLHFMAFDDHEEQDKKAMRDKEDYCLKLLEE